MDSLGRGNGVQNMKYKSEKASLEITWEIQKVLYGMNHIPKYA